MVGECWTQIQESPSWICVSWRVASMVPRRRWLVFWLRWTLLVWLEADADWIWKLWWKMTVNWRVSFEVFTLTPVDFGVMTNGKPSDVENEGLEGQGSPSISLAGGMLYILLVKTHDHIFKCTTSLPAFHPTITAFSHFMSFLMSESWALLFRPKHSRMTGRIEDHHASPQWDLSRCWYCLLA